MSDLDRAAQARARAAAELTGAIEAAMRAFLERSASPDAATVDAEVTATLPGMLAARAALAGQATATSSGPEAAEAPPAGRGPRAERVAGRPDDAPGERPWERLFEEVRSNLDLDLGGWNDLFRGPGPR